MILALVTCPDGWRLEYSGFLVSCYKSSTDIKRSSYVCLDGAPEGTTTAAWTDEKALFLPTEVLCTQLPCSTYTNGQDVNCVVCSK